MNKELVNKENADSSATIQKKVGTVGLEIPRKKSILGENTFITTEEL